MRVKWLERALFDLDDIEAFVSLDDPAAANGVVLKIVKSVSLMQEQPGMGRAGRISGTRELVIADTPYIVPYRVKDNAVQILRVYHTSRKWPDRF